MVPYKDHSGKRLLFSDAIITMARDRHGLDWELPSTGLTVRIIPESIENASDEEQIYAANFLREGDTSIIISQIIEEYDEDIPCSLRNRFLLDIDTDNWKWISTLSEITFEDRSLTLQQLFDVMVEFAVSASEGTTKCYLRKIDTFSDRELEPSAWQVNLDTLKVRFSSDIIEIKNNMKDVEKHMIIVERSTLPCSNSLFETTYEQKLTSVRHRLREAMEFSKKACPHGKISVLRADISEYLSCDLLQSTSIIDDVTNGCWSQSGQKGSTKNPIRVTP